LWEHSGSHQLNHIHDRLIGALAIVIADACGDQLLRLPPHDRVMGRVAEELEAQLRNADDPGPESI
jgi:hypothetical protein